MTKTTDTLYHVIDRNGDIVAENLPLEHAADVMLGYDGARWEIRLEGPNDGDPDGYSFWALYWRGMNDRSLRRTVFFSVAETEEAATREILEEVVSKDADYFGVEAVPSDVWEHDNFHCECGEALGLCCDWTGPLSETVLVEYMPEHLRGSHIAAGNCGTYPGNGAIRIRCEESCAQHVLEGNGDWAAVCTDDDIN